MSNSPLTPDPPPAPVLSDAPTDFNISDEFGTARKNLPPAGIVAICLAVVIAIVAIYSLTHRAHPRSTGSIDGIFAAAVPNQDMVMVAINVSLQNNSQKPSWIKSIRVGADVGGKEQSDDAIPVVDAQRYLESFPELKSHTLQLLAVETRINPGEKFAGTVLASFPLTADAFAARKSVTVTILPYDEVAIVLTK
jgi:hypothetical protein